MHSSTLLTTAALVAAAAAVTEVSTTATVPGLTLTLPVGISTSTTKTISPHTVTGKAAVISGVTVIVDSSSVYFLDGNNFADNAISGTNEYNGITVVNGNIPGATAASTTGGSTTASASTTTMTGSTTITTTNAMGSTMTTTSAVTSTTTTKPNAGERAFGAAQMFGWAGVAVGAAAAANY